MSYFVVVGEKIPTVCDRLPQSSAEAVSKQTIGYFYLYVIVCFLGLSTYCVLSSILFMVDTECYTMSARAVCSGRRIYWILSVLILHDSQGVWLNHWLSQVTLCYISLYWPFSSTFMQISEICRLFNLYSRIKSRLLILDCLNVQRLLYDFVVNSWCPKLALCN